MRVMSALFVPKLFSTDQNAAQASIAQDLLDYVESHENNLKTVKTCDES